MSYQGSPMYKIELEDDGLCAFFAPNDVNATYASDTQDMKGR